MYPSTHSDNVLESKLKSGDRSKASIWKNEPPKYKTTFPKGTFAPTLTFDDILLVPQYGEINSRYSDRQ